MKHRDSLSGDIVTVELSGKLIAGDQLTSFLGRVQYYLSLNKNRFIVDLHDVERMNSAGIGAMVAAHTAATRAGGKFVLTNITRVEDLLNVTQLMRVFESYDSREEAVTALQ